VEGTLRSALYELFFHFIDDPAMFSVVRYELVQQYSDYYGVMPRVQPTYDEIALAMDF
jgi:hypothetical protein